jgi:hypothetical protein
MIVLILSPVTIFLFADSHRIDYQAVGRIKVGCAPARKWLD